MCQVEGESYLFTSGYVPWWDEFPGAHIPAPIQIGSTGPTDIEARCREILMLSKMNWNSSDGITRLPVTLLFAKKVGEIMPEPLRQCDAESLVPISYVVSLVDLATVGARVATRTEDP